jgi:hypothetical protein
MEAGETGFRHEALFQPGAMAPLPRIGPVHITGAGRRQVMPRPDVDQHRGAMTILSAPPDALPAGGLLSPLVTVRPRQLSVAIPRFSEICYYFAHVAEG